VYGTGVTQVCSERQACGCIILNCIAEVRRGHLGMDSGRGLSSGQAVFGSASKTDKNTHTHTQRNTQKKHTHTQKHGKAF